MKSIEEALKDLKDIIDKTDINIPFVKGKNIRIKNVIIRKTQQGYTIVDMLESKTIGQTFSKVAAIALAKSYLKGKNADNILSYDKKIEKHFNDCYFYKHSLRNANSQLKQDLYECRLQVSEQSISQARNALESYILDYENS